MKKILFLMCIAFISVTQVNAANACDGSKNACAICVYKFTDFDISFVVKSDGGSSANLEKKLDNHPMSNMSVDVNSSGVDAANFVSPSKNKLVCPSAIFYKADAGQTNKTFSLYSSQPSDSKAKQALDSSSYNNDKTLNGDEEGGSEEGSNEDGGSETIACPYTSETLVGTTIQKNGPVVTVSSNGKTKPKITAEDGWKINNEKSKVTAADFMSSGKLECPALYASCMGDGDNKYCTVSTEKLTSTGSEPEKPEPKENADDIERNMQKLYFEIKPNIEVNMNFGEGECGVISKDLSEFLQWVVDTIRIIGIVLTIVLSIVEYAKAAFSNNDDAMKTANKGFSTRLACAALLLLVPAIVELALVLFDVGVTADDPSCGIH